ncbi:TIGR04282 family arsenosugar biosynthesis glycosyltransferase [Streptomyces sp. NPDC005070]
MSVTLLVIAKEPRPGRVKTRLTPPFTPGEAATLAEAALVDTLRAVAATPARRRVLVLDGAPGPWLPAGFDVVRQCAGGLDERLAAAFAGCDGPALLIGMDTPQVTPALLTVDFADCDAYFGPAEDGGFWALGLAEPDPELLRGVPMSTDTTGAVQRRRLVGAGLRVRDLPRLRDVDTAADATAVAAAAPGGAFTRELHRLGTMVAPGAGDVPPPSRGEATGTAPGLVAGHRTVQAAGIPPGVRTGRDIGPVAGQRGAGR